MIYLGDKPVGITKVRPVISDEWRKPSDWPDIEALQITQSDNVVLYLLYDCETEVRYAGFTLDSSGGTDREVSIAKYVDGTLSAFDSSSTFSSAANYYCPLPSDCKYAVVKVICQGKVCFATNATYPPIIITSPCAKLSIFAIP